MSHVCHAINGTKEVPPRMFMCSKHWYMVHKHFRTLVWRYYIPGQEIIKKASLEYILVTMFAKFQVKRQEIYNKTKPALCDLPETDILYMSEQIAKHRKYNTNPYLIKYCIDLFDTTHPDFKK